MGSLLSVRQNGDGVRWSWAFSRGAQFTDLSPFSPICCCGFVFFFSGPSSHRPLSVNQRVFSLRDGRADALLIFTDERHFYLFFFFKKCEFILSVCVCVCVCVKSSLSVLFLDTKQLKDPASIPCIMRFHTCSIQAACFFTLRIMRSFWG